MHLNTGTIKVAGPTLLASFACVLLCAPAHAETVKTVNGAPIDSEVVDIYMQGRTNKPAAQVTAEERETIMRELTDIYLLSTQEVVGEIEKNPQFQAQLELQRRGVLAQAVASRFLAGTTISDAEIQAEYDTQIKLAPPLQFKARHILVETQSAASDIIGRLDKGANFEELAKSESTGPSASNGGDLNWFSPDQMVKPFSDAVADLKDGEYTKAPVQTQFGWHVILREDSRESEPPPLDSVRDKIQQELQNRKFQDYLASLRDKETG